MMCIYVYQFKCYQQVDNCTSCTVYHQEKQRQKDAEQARMDFVDKLNKEVRNGKKTDTEQF